MQKPLRKQSAAIRAAREQYDKGVPLNRIARRFHMSRSEIEDMAPEEIETDTPGPENDIGGY